jgi:DNA gyrase subunit A
MDKYKYTSDKPYSATNAPVAEAMKHFYIHGNSSCLGIIMRASQPFAMRYPLVDVKGNGGTLMSSGNWAAARYTKTRLSKLSKCLFSDIDKDVINEWRDNFAEDEQYPSVLPSKGFYNIVNGTSGIGIGMASSIPQFNIKDVNEALIKLLWNPNIDFEEIYCAPDFATGAILLNEEQVKDSLKNGTGFACKLRAVIEYDTKERCLVATEIPYGVYTNTICGELEAILNAEDNPGIDRFNDLTGSTPLIKIYLTKNANVDRVIKYLYKNTSLQSHYGINMTMLEDGRYPRVFGWKDALLNHLKHEELVYRRGFEFDLEKINKRLHILDGLLIALANIEEVVQIIKGSTSTAAAREKLQEKFLLTDVQAKAILDMKLSRLASLEVKKLENEKAELLIEKERIEAILNNKELLYKEIENGFNEVAKKFGDARRTKVMNIEGEEDEPVEVKSLQLSLTNKNNIFVTESSSLYTQKRGGVGTKLKLGNGEFVLSSINIENVDTVMFFTNTGNLYNCSATALMLNTLVAIESVCAVKPNEQVVAISSMNKKNAKPHILFFTEKGMIKKSLVSDYNTKRTTGVKALTLDDGDCIKSIIFTDSDRVGILTELGNFVIIETKDIRAIGRTAKGVKAIKLNEGDCVVSAKIIPTTTTDIASVSNIGLIKKTPIADFGVQGRGTKGSKIQKIGEDEWIADFYPLTTETEILVASNNSCIKFSVSEIPTLSKGAAGSRSIKLSPNSHIVGISKS